MAFNDLAALCPETSEIVMPLQQGGCTLHGWHIQWFRQMPNFSVFKHLSATPSLNLPTAPPMALTDGSPSPPAQILYL